MISREALGVLARIAPALLGTVTVVGMAIVGLDARSTLDVRYFDEAEMALEQGQRDVAAMCYERALDLSIDKERAKFGLARVAFLKGDVAFALMRMQELAPRATKGYGPAHRWLGDYLLNNAKTLPSVELAAAAHYHFAVEDDPNSVPAHDSLFSLYHRRGDFSRAETHLLELERLNAINPYVKAYFYWNWSRRIGGTNSKLAATQRQRALDQITATVAGLEHNVARSPDDDTSRAQLGAIYAIQGNYALAETLLAEGLQRTAARVLRDALGYTYLSWSEKLATEDPGGDKRLALLLKALQLVPQSPHVYTQLAALGQLEGEAAMNAQVTLQAELANNPSRPELVHLLLAQLAWTRGDDAQAVFHCERAQASATPLGPIITNNLAYYLAHKHPPDLDRALSLIEPVVATHPDALRFLDTRGRILLKLGKVREALADLEKAAPGVQDRRGLNLAFAEIYDRLGMPSQAETYRKAAAAAKGPRR